MNKFSIWLASLFCLVFIVSSVAAFSGSGAGTSGDPYQITNYSQLQEINNAKTSYYKLMNDITCSGSWTPIDLTANGATGFQLDGNGHRISNLYISGSYQYSGFISAANTNPVLKSPTFVNITFYNATVSSSYGDETNDGVLIGKTDGTINANIVDKVFIYGSSVSGYSAGGYHGVFIGAMRGGANIKDSAAYDSEVSPASSGQGALTGSMYGDVEDITKCWANISAKSIIAVRGGTTTVSGSYWDNGFGTSGYGGTSTSTSDMKIQGTYSGWDFTNTWKMSSSGGDYQGYPIFKWMIDAVTPVTNFTPSSWSEAAPANVSFTDTSTNTPTSWFWVFGDGNTSTVQNPYHLYETAGVYYANLTATNAAGSNTSGLHTITIGDLPTGDFTKNVTGGASPCSVAFTGSFSGTAPLTYLWVFGDGNTSAATNPTHTFYGAGTYYTNVTVSNAFGSIQTATQSITVGTLPVSSFTRTPAYGTAPLTVSFTFTGANAVSYLWDFDDGTTDTDPNPSHQFTNVGTYHVNVTATNAYGSTLSEMKSVIVGATASSGFTIVPNLGEQPLNVTFTATGEDVGWVLANATPFANRTQHRTVVLSNDKIVVMGGYGTGYMRDIYTSTNNGTTWTSLGNAGWSGREYHAACVQPDDDIFVVAGYGSGSQYMNDTWRSQDDGASWSSMSTNNPWGNRYTNVVCESNGDIILLGGSNATNYMNDVWKSTDDGVTWTLQTASTGWAGRRQLAAVTMHDGSIILSGGLTSSTLYHDVWRSTDEGVTWTQQTAAASWSIRYGHTMVVLPNDVLVLMGGLGVGGSYRNDTWYSKDYGVTWTQYSMTTPWTARTGLKAVAMNNGLVVMTAGGSSSANYGDIWKFDPMGITTYAFSGTGSVTNASRTFYHEYPAMGTFYMNLSVTNIFGTVKSADYPITVTLQNPYVFGIIANVTSGTGQVPPSLPVQFSANYSGGAPTSYAWYFNGTFSSDASPVVTFSNPGIYPVNITLINANGTSFYNGSYSVLGKAPHMTMFSATPGSGSNAAPTPNITFQVTFNTTHYGTPTTYLWTWGDGHTSTTNPAYHIYTSSGTFAGSIRASNAWGYDQYNFSYSVPPQTASILKWVDKNGLTITNDYTGKNVSFSFNTLSNGENPPVGYIADYFYLQFYHKDQNTANWLYDNSSYPFKAMQPGDAVFTDYTTNNGVYGGMPAQGAHSWIGYGDFPTIAKGTYRAQIIAVNITDSVTYPTVSLGYADLVVIDNPINFSNVGDTSTDVGGWGLNLVIAALIVLGLVAVPYAVMRVFNIYIEVFMAVLGIGFGYFLHLIDGWIIAGMIILAGVIIFFMYKGGGDGGSPPEGGEIG